MYISICSYATFVVRLHNFNTMESIMLILKLRCNLMSDVGQKNEKHV